MWPVPNGEGQRPQQVGRVARLAAAVGAKSCAAGPLPIAAEREVDSCREVGEDVGVEEQRLPTQTE